MGCVFQRQCRCTCVILWLECFGRAGRSVIKAIVLTLIITGPINNLILNSGEVVKTFKCSTRLTYNLTKVKFDLLAKPFHNALMGMTQNMSDVKNVFGSVRNALEPIEIEVETKDKENVPKHLEDSQPIKYLKKFLFLTNISFHH